MLENSSHKINLIPRIYVRQKVGSNNPKDCYKNCIFVQLNSMKAHLAQNHMVLFIHMEKINAINRTNRKINISQQKISISARYMHDVHVLHARCPTK